MVSLGYDPLDATGKLVTDIANVLVGKPIEEAVIALGFCLANALDEVDGDRRDMLRDGVIGGISDTGIALAVGMKKGE